MLPFYRPFERLRRRADGQRPADRATRLPAGGQPVGALRFGSGELVIRHGDDAYELWLISKPSKSGPVL